MNTIKTNKKESPKSTVVAIITKNSNDSEYILITQRKVEPYQEKWCLPGGHINTNEEKETALKAVIREVKEETGLDYCAEFYDYFDEIIPEREIHAVVLIFKGLSTGKLQKHNEEVKDAKWVLLSDSLKYDLAFRHKEIIKKYMQNKINKQNENGILNELNYLRREIESRFETRNRMMYFTFLIAGIILAFGRIEGYILFPIIGTFLAGLWSHSDIRIHEIGDYIKNCIEPKIPGLYWENYLYDKYHNPKIEKKGKRQEKYALRVFNTIYMIMLILLIVNVVSENNSLTNISNAIELQDILIISFSFIISILCMHITGKYIKERRNHYDSESEKN
jgi:8-oxo-dGTP pyrophosphatase MutT (NUDIX family)